MIYKSVNAQAIEFFTKNKNLPDVMQKLEANQDYIAMMEDIDLDNSSEESNTETQEQQGE